MILFLRYFISSIALSVIVLAIGCLIYYLYFDSVLVIQSYSGYLVLTISYIVGLVIAIFIDPNNSESDKPDDGEDEADWGNL